MQFTQPLQAGDSEVVIAGEPGATATIRDLAQTGGPVLAEAVLQEGENAIALTERLSGGHVLAALGPNDAVATAVVEGTDYYGPPPPPAPPPPSLLPLPPIHCLLRGDEPPAVANWLIPDIGNEADRAVCILYDPKTGALAYGEIPENGQRGASWGDLEKVAREWQPDLSDIDDLMRVFVLSEALYIPGFHHCGGGFGGDEREVLRNVTGLVRRLLALDAIPLTLSVIMATRTEGVSRTTVADW